MNRNKQRIRLLSAIWMLPCFVASSKLMAGPSTAEKARKNRSANVLVAKKNNRSQTRASVGKMFAAGMTKFEAGKFQDALVIFDRILKKFPGFEPTKKMLGRTLYKLERYPEAWTFFSKVPPHELDADTAYEFAVVAFNARQYEAALMGFNKVPDGHVWHDLAGYYGGLSAIKLKKYDEAEKLLRQAQVLPDRLARSRAVYLKHVQSIKLMQEQSELQKERELERQRITKRAGGPGLSRSSKPAPTEPTAATETQPSSKASGSALETPYQHQGFKSISKAVTFRGEQRTQHSSNSQMAESNTNLQIGSFRFQNGPLMTFTGTPQSIKPGSAGKKNAFGMQILFGGEDRGVSGRERRIVITEDDRDIVRLQQSSTIKSHSQYAYVGADPWLEFNMGENLWLQTGISTYFEYPDFKRLGRSGIIKGQLGLGAIRSNGSWLLTGSAGSLYNSDNKQITDTKEGSLALTHNFSSSTSGTVEGSIKDFNYKDQSLDGPDQSLSLGLTVSHQFAAGLGTSLFSAYEKQKNAFFYGLPEVEELSADGDVLTVQFGLNYSPAKWISFDLNHVISKTTWSVHDKANETAFKQNVPDYLTALKGGLSILFPF